MRIGLSIGDLTSPRGPACLGHDLAAVAHAADELGFDSLSVMDHYFQIPLIGPPERDMLEGYTTLGYLAGVTRRLKLGTLVTGVHYRHPGLLAKIVTTLDVLSGGRAFLGLGAAWYEREHTALGVPYPPVGERFGLLEEALQICQQMWSDDGGPFDGTYSHLAETIYVPRP